MIHPCSLLSHILTAEISDKLFHAVINIQTIWPVKSSMYSTTFQIHEQKGFLMVSTHEVLPMLENLTSPPISHAKQNLDQ